MSIFKNWLQQHLQRENFLSSSGSDYERDLQDLVKTVMTKHQPEFLRFLRHLVDQRGDLEIKELLQKIEGGEQQFSKVQDPAEIVTPLADRGISST